MHSVTPADLDFAEPGVVVTPIAEATRAAARRVGAPRWPFHPAALRMPVTPASTSGHPGASRSSSRAGRPCCRTSSATRWPSAPRLAARKRIAAKDVELRTSRGLDTVHLAVAIAAWRIGGVSTAPVLLRLLARSGGTTSTCDLKLHPFCRQPRTRRGGAHPFGISLGGALAEARLRRRGLQAAAGHRPPPRSDGCVEHVPPCCRAWSSRPSPTWHPTWCATPPISTTPC